MRTRNPVKFPLFVATAIACAISSTPSTSHGTEYKNGAEYHAPFLQQPDTQKHIAISAIGTVALIEVFDFTPAQATLTMLAIGAVKEVVDYNTKPSWARRDCKEDMAANVIGAGSIYLSYTVRF